MSRLPEKKFAIMAALVLVTSVAFAICLPQLAFCDDDLGDVSEPATGSKSSTDNTSNSQETSPNSNVKVSSEGAGAVMENCSFGLKNFSRAQVGSNRAIDDQYYGYCYYSGDSSGKLTVIATDKYAVIYTPETERAGSFFSASSKDDQGALKSILTALDANSSSGGLALSSLETVYFTSEKSYAVGNVLFNFDQELKQGKFYACVIGADGSDVTSSESPNYTKLAFADFAEIVKSDEVEITEAETGMSAFLKFLSEVDLSPLWVTLKTTLVAIVFIFVLGLAAAYFSLRISPRLQDIADAIFTIPMVLPPTVCGFLLLMICGNNTAFGRFFIDIGFPLIFSWPATVIAAVVVAFPLMYRSARGAFESLDQNMLDCARTLGWSNSKVFFRLMLPLAWSSIAAGTVLSFARALGEFGATLFLAGNYLGITRTIPIAIYFEWMNGNYEVTWFWIVVIMIFSFIVILFINIWSNRTTRYRKRQS